MPSNFLSKLHSGPVNRSCVSVAAMGTIQSGNDFDIEGTITVGGRRKAEVRTQKAEGGRQDAEGRRQKAEGGRQKAEGRGQDQARTPKCAYGRQWLPLGERPTLWLISSASVPDSSPISIGLSRSIS